MVTTYGSFPGVKVEVAGGGITSVAIGEEEKLVLFGEASYQNDDTFPGDGDEDPLESGLNGSTEEPISINARREADTNFGSDSELATEMRKALANGANIDFIYGVAPKRFNRVGEVETTATGTLSNAPIWEEDVEDESNITGISVTDTSDTDPTVEYSYDSPPAQPSSTAAETIVINPITGEYAAEAAPTGEYEFSYKYLDWDSAVDNPDVRGVVEEDETGIFDAITESDTVSTSFDDVVEGTGSATGLRENFQLVNVLSGAQPNDSQVVTTDGDALASDHSNYQRRDARYDTDTFSQGSVDSDHYFKFAPVRREGSSQTVLGGVGGLFAGNPINDPIYNDQISEYDQIEQSFTKSEADDMRDANVIPLRQSGSIRVKDNLSTSTSTDWERDFWRRRIVDRVLLIGKTVGDTIIGRINDPDTRAAAARLIRAEIRELVDDRLLKPNTDDETRWFVDVYEDSENPNEVNIDIGVTPFGIVKRIDESITIST